MWSMLTSFFLQKNCADSEELSLEKACSLLENSHPGTCVTNKDIKSTNENQGDILSTRIGIITNIVDDHCIIDDNHICTKNVLSLNLAVGTKVSYEILSSQGKEKVVKVSSIETDWDTPENKNQICTNRIFVCKVEKRLERKLFLSPGDIDVDLDNTSLEFLPVIGDWLELDVKCTINENSVDLCGKLIEINKISPVRPHVVIGTVSSWNIKERTGVINRNIFFTESSLNCGYVPKVGDKVVVQVIESEQNRCCWRAIQVIPESLKTETKTLLTDTLSNVDFIDDHPGILFEGLNIFHENINTTKYFFVTISNHLEKNINLQKVEILSKNSQCKMIDVVSEHIINKGSYFKIKFQNICRNVGVSKDFILFTFEEFIIGKWLTNILSIQTSHISNQSFNYNNSSKMTKNDYSNNQLIRAPNSKSRFQAVKLPSYEVPQKLLNFICQYENQKDIAIILEELRVIKPVLFLNLSYTNYEDKFHTLLHLDEIANLIAIRNYDQEKACFIRNGEFLMLEIENLSERRPSIILGDKIIATDPLNLSGIDYEGMVHKVAAKHVYLKFTPIFHDQYNGEDYSIRVVPGRNSYRVLHHAIYLAVRNLGADLFPSKMVSKQPQLNFSFENTRNVDKKDEVDSSEEKIELQWYNKALNLPQQNAVINILKGKARPLPYVIFGPPGTGKTVTLIEVVLQITRSLPQSRLLITAPSNSAADLIALRLIQSGVLKPGDLVRLVSYNYAMSESVPASLVPYCVTGSSAKEGTTNATEYAENGISMGCNRTTIGRHRITVATCSAAGQLFNMGLSKGHFSHIIVDEAAQAAEPDVMIPISFLDKTTGQIILAGDPMQLGPVILCRIAAECGLAESYLERLINRFPYVRDSEGFPNTLGYDPNLVTKLVYNYRSLPDILGLYSSLFYRDELVAAIEDEFSEEAQLLSRLEEMLPVKICGKTSRIIFHGVDGENYQSEESPSWCNPYEAAQVFYYVNECYRLGLKNTNIGIISPYIKQVKEIRSLFIEAEFDMPKIGTVEEFQGQEFDVIIISTVRSCAEYVSYDVTHSLGFVSNPKRLNVAVSRAKSLLIIVGNPKLLCQDVYWRSVVQYCLERGSYVGCELP